MADITYKKFSELTQTTTLGNNDLFPIAQFISGIDYNSKAITFQTLYNQASGFLITPFTTSIQAAVNATLSSDKWNSTYSNVQSNSASWGATSTGILSAFSQGNITTPQVVRFLSAGTTANASVAFIATGTGATLAQLPDNGIGGGNARGQYATDLQKSRVQAVEVASGDYSVIGGGALNKSSGNYTSILGGFSNTASGNYSSIVGGYGNTASGLATVVNGDLNTASGDYSSIVGGQNNSTNSKQNAHIIGSNITAPSANYTYVNNISSQGTVAANNFKYSTSTATFASGPIFINAAQAQLHYIVYTGTTTPVDLHISDILNEPGREVKIHIVNRAGGQRALTPKYVSTNPAITGGIPLTTTGLVASAANTGLMAISAIATIWVANIGGNIVGSFG